MQETWVWSLVWEDPWRRETLLTPVSWPGEFHQLYDPWGCKESDTTERLSLHFIHLLMTIMWKVLWLMILVIKRHWASSGSWLWIGLLQSVGSQRIRHNWATKPKWGHMYVQGLTIMWERAKHKFQTHTQQAVTSILKDACVPTFKSPDPIHSAW